MTKQLHILIIICFINFSKLYSQNTDVKINKEYQRIENLKTLRIDSLSLIRGIDFNQGSNADEKIYKIYKEKKRIVKIEYQEIHKGYRKWDKKTTIYLKNNIPYFITENTNGVMTLYTNEGEKSKPYKEKEEIYVYDWDNEKIKRVYNGHEATPQMKLCKVCYGELIEKIKLEFKSKPDVQSLPTLRSNH